MSDDVYHNDYTYAYDVYVSDNYVSDAGNNDVKD